MITYSIQVDDQSPAWSDFVKNVEIPKIVNPNRTPGLPNSDDNPVLVPAFASVDEFIQSVLKSTLTNMMIKTYRDKVVAAIPDISKSLPIQSK